MVWRRLATVALLLLGGLVGPADASPNPARKAAAPACFGAAARDPERPCVNRALDLRAIPSPDDAPLEPSAPCTPTRRSSPQVCAFGAPRHGAVSTVALLGDSHSTHWRAALAVVAGARRWHGVSINRDTCPFTLARTHNRDAMGRCSGWTRSVLRWLRSHPEVRSVVVSANSGSGVDAAPGLTRRATKINGYLDAWTAIPSSVRDIYVIRDVPHSRHDTSACVSRALARRRSPGRRCARPRAGALRPDLGALAARQTTSDRVHLIDLSRFMCDDDRCFPVVGGALVIRDIGHLTRTFSTTLGPYLGRAIVRLESAGAR